MINQKNSCEMETTNENEIDFYLQAPLAEVGKNIKKY